MSVNGGAERTAYYRASVLSRLMKVKYGLPGQTSTPVKELSILKRVVGRQTVALDLPKWMLAIHDLNRWASVLIPQLHQHSTPSGSRKPSNVIGKPPSQRRFTASILIPQLHHTIKVGLSDADPNPPPERLARVIGQRGIKNAPNIEPARPTLPTRRDNHARIIALLTPRPSGRSETQ